MKVAALLAALVLLPAPALASHMGSYTYNPVEHDDQGSSDEPDHLATGVLGVPVANRVIDADLDYNAEPDSASPAGMVLAPGCTDASGARQPSGMCGLWTVGFTQQTVGFTLVERHTMGVREGSGPGITGKGARTVRFLDARVDVVIPTVATGSQFINLNKKLQDTGASALLQSVDEDFGAPLANPGPVAIWAWYGTWNDRNGNGVVDHLGLPDDSGLVFEDNEFLWGGQCTLFDGSPGGSVPCIRDPPGSNPTMWAFLWPGNHHGYCGGFVDPLGATCTLLPADRPGGQVVGFVDVLLPNPLGFLWPIGPGCSTPFFTDYDRGCMNDVSRADYNDELGFGDPLLGPQEGVAPDGKFHDRGGDPTTSVRHIVYGDGWPTWFYDQSLLVSSVFTTVIGCPPSPASPNRLVLTQCRFVDVDKYESWFPDLGAFLQEQVKPAARAKWVLVRDGLGGYLGPNPQPLDVAHRIMQERVFYDATLGPLRGALNARLDDPGFAREPNRGSVDFARGAADAYPGAVHGACTGPDAGERTFNGWCNRYDGYAAAPHAWADLHPARLAYYMTPLWIAPGGSCIQCVSGATIAIPFAGEPMPDAFPRPHGNHERTLGAGIYNWFGLTGLWHDTPQTWRELVLDAVTLESRWVTYTNTKDGWVGNIVNATGTFYSRGYTDEDCDTDQGPGRHTYAECHPYLDGNLGNPQQAGDRSHGEWTGRRCETTTEGMPNIRISLYPKGGAWTVPVYRWVAHQNGFALIDPASLTPLAGLVLEDRTGSTGPISITASCFASGESGGFAGNDLLVLPEGNLGLDIASVLTTTVPLGGGAREAVQDVDYYVGWGV